MPQCFIVWLAAETFVMIKGLNETLRANAHTYKSTHTHTSKIDLPLEDRAILLLGNYHHLFLRRTDNSSFNGNEQRQLTVTGDKTLGFDCSMALFVLAQPFIYIAIAPQNETAKINISIIARNLCSTPHRKIYGRLLFFCCFLHKNRFFSSKRAYYVILYHMMTFHTNKRTPSPDRSVARSTLWMWCGLPCTENQCNAKCPCVSPSPTGPH